MFFCETCRVDNQWPTSLRRSQGQCECCNTYASCYDVPSRRLPMPPRTPVPPTSPLEPQTGEPNYVETLTLVSLLATTLSAVGRWVDESTHPLGRQFATDNLAQARNLVRTIQERLAADELGREGGNYYD